MIMSATQINIFKKPASGYELVQQLVCDCKARFQQAAGAGRIHTGYSVTIRPSVLPFIKPVMDLGCDSLLSCIFCTALTFL